MLKTQGRTSIFTTLETIGPRSNGRSNTNGCVSAPLYTTLTSYFPAGMAVKPAQVPEYRRLRLYLGRNRNRFHRSLSSEDDSSFELLGPTSPAPCIVVRNSPLLSDRTCS